jgi:dihydroorotate dehydrogenase (fumarate)
VHDGVGVVKQLLAGARAVQVCSALFLKGMERIKIMLEELTAWMDRHGYQRIEEFRGKMCQESSGKPALYERLQYIKVYVGLD